MKRIRLILAMVLCLALISISTGAAAASKAATTVPTVKITAPKKAVRGGVGGDITITPSVPGFLTLKLLSDDGAEIATLCENLEVHTKANTVEFTASDADGSVLPEGSYKLSATIVNQYGKESKEATATFKVGSPRPSLTDVTVSASKAFKPVVSYTANFDDEMVSVDFSVYRMQPKPAFFDDYGLIEHKKPTSDVTDSIDLQKGNDLPSAAGYYTLKGTVSEYISGIVSEQIVVDFLVDASGSVYMLEDASEEVIASVDEIVEEITAAITAGELDEVKIDSSASGFKSTTTASSGKGKADASNKKEEADAEEENEEEAQQEAPKKSASEADELAYGSGDAVLGEEGLEIGVGVSDAAAQTDAGYWTLTSASTDEEIWKAITRQMISVDVAEQESAYIYNSPEEGRKSIGTVSGLSQGLNVIKERDDGWSLVEAFRNEDGAFVRGYIRTNKLRVVEPNTEYGLVLDKKAQKLTVWKGGQAIGSCDVTTGLPTAKYLHRETPAGEYVLVTRRGTIEYYGNGFSKYTIRFSGNYHLCEIPTTKKNGTDYTLLEDSLGEKATRGHICLAHDASSDGGINAEWIWEMTTDNKRVKLLILDDKDRSEVPVGE